MTDHPTGLMESFDAFVHHRHQAAELAREARDAATHRNPAYSITATGPDSITTEEHVTTPAPADHPYLPPTAANQFAPKDNRFAAVAMTLDGLGGSFLALSGNKLIVRLDNEGLGKNLTDDDLEHVVAVVRSFDKRSPAQ